MTGGAHYNDVLATEVLQRGLHTSYVVRLSRTHAPLLLSGAALASGGGREGRGKFQQGGTGGGEWGVSGGSTSRERVTAETACKQSTDGCAGVLALVPSSMRFSLLHHRSHTAIPLTRLLQPFCPSLVLVLAEEHDCGLLSRRVGW